jgi:hypothetical protein
MVVGSVPDEVAEFFQISCTFRPHYGPGADSASNRNVYQKIFLWGNGQLVCKADNLNISEPYGPPWPIAGIALLLFLMKCLNLEIYTNLNNKLVRFRDRLCGLVVRVPGYRSRGPGSIPGATRFPE